MKPPASKSASTPGFPVLAPGIAFVVLYLLARILLKEWETSPGLRVIVALLPVPAFGLFLWQYSGIMRKMDELQVRQTLEAIAWAFGLTFLLICTLGLLELAITLPKEDLSYRHLLPILALFFIIGLLISRRSYE